MIYYPYFRGRLYDLLALKDLLPMNTLGSQIIPIIEPVKDSKQLQAVVASFVQAEQPLAIVTNPQVGRYQFNTDKLHSLAPYLRAPTILPTAHVAADFSPAIVPITDKQRRLLIIQQYALFTLFRPTLAKLPNTSSLVPNEARLTTKVEQPKIYLADHYRIPEHSSEYRQLPDELFSTDHLTATLDGYAGFSDYTVVGAPYFEHGFPARTITLHLVYADNLGRLRIHHFSSSLENERQGQAVKFFEALTALTTWVDRYCGPFNRTPALQALMDYQTQQKFPGLGVLKKLAIMHHLQLMHRLLTEPTTHLRSLTHAATKAQLFQNPTRSLSLPATGRVSSQSSIGSHLINR